MKAYIALKSPERLQHLKRADGITSPRPVKTRLASHKRDAETPFWDAVNTASIPQEKWTPEGRDAGCSYTRKRVFWGFFSAFAAFRKWRFTLKNKWFSLVFQLSADDIFSPVHLPISSLGKVMIIKGLTFDSETSSRPCPRFVSRLHHSVVRALHPECTCMVLHFERESLFEESRVSIQWHLSSLTRPSLYRRTKRCASGNVDATPYDPLPSIIKATPTAIHVPDHRRLVMAGQIVLELGCQIGTVASSIVSSIWLGGLHS